MSQLQRTLVVGDLHGCIEELDEMLTTVSFVKGRDRLVTVGDLVDRGPDSIGVIRRFRELGGVGVRGNHDDKHLQWLWHQKKHKESASHVVPKFERFESEHKKLAASFSEDDVNWLHHLPYTYRLNNRTVVVHAGLETGKPFEKQGPAVMRCSWLRNDGTKAAENDFRDTHYWTELYKGPDNVLYGHKARDHSIPTLTQPVESVFCLGLDTGCVWGGHLTGLYLPSNELVQIRAKKEYARRGSLPLPLFGDKEKKKSK